MSKSWKAAESRIGVWYGAKGIKNSGRQPLSGGNSGVTRGDAPHDTIFIESKRDKKYHSAIKLWRDYKVKNELHVVSLPLVNDKKVISKFSDIWCVYSKDLFTVSEYLINNNQFNIMPWKGNYPSALTLYFDSVSVKNSTNLDINKELVTCNLVYHGHPGFWIIINKNDIIRCCELIVESRIKRELLIKEDKSWGADATKTSQK